MECEKKKKKKEKTKTTISEKKRRVTLHVSVFIPVYARYAFRERGGSELIDRNE